MRLAVFGATGGTGRQLTQQALERGHDVVVLARNPAAVRAEHPRLRVEQGDVLDPTAVDRVVDGCDAVASALGIGYRRHATTVYSAGTRNILTSMRRSGVFRIVVVSTSSIQVPPLAHFGEWAVSRLLLHPLLRKPYSDMIEMERLVRASDRRWSLVRAARLTNGQRTGKYRSATDAKLRGCWSISRADVAHYMLRHLEDHRIYRRTIELAY